MSTHELPTPKELEAVLKEFDHPDHDVFLTTDTFYTPGSDPEQQSCGLCALGMMWLHFHPDQLSRVLSVPRVGYHRMTNSPVTTLRNEISSWAKSHYGVTAVEGFLEGFDDADYKPDDPEVDFVTQNSRRAGFLCLNLLP